MIITEHNYTLTAFLDMVYSYLKSNICFTLYDPNFITSYRVTHTTLTFCKLGTIYKSLFPSSGNNMEAHALT